MCTACSAIAQRVSLAALLETLSVEYSPRVVSPPFYDRVGIRMLTPKMNNYDWTDQFLKLYEVALKKYEDGNRQVETYFSHQEKDFLARIGCRPMEIYDFVEDAPDLSYETALLITAARRDYFLTKQQGEWSNNMLKIEDFPEKKDSIEGIEWLPRIILKAKARLRGELPVDLMYCCGGDRSFLNRHNIHPADFLRLVWSAMNDDAKIVEFVEYAT